MVMKRRAPVLSGLLHQRVLSVSIRDGLKAKSLMINISLLTYKWRSKVLSDVIFLKVMKKQEFHKAYFLI